MAVLMARSGAGPTGCRTHRSWWVARPAFADTRREGGRTFLVLGNSGKAAPVSAALASAREAGRAYLDTEAGVGRVFINEDV